jgi:hypothetical protein
MCLDCGICCKVRYQYNEYNLYANMTYEKYHISKMKSALYFGEKTYFIQHYNAMNRHKHLNIIVLNVLIHLPGFLYVMKTTRLLKNKMRSNKLIRGVFDKLTKQ